MASFPPPELFLLIASHVELPTLVRLRFLYRVPQHIPTVLCCSPILYFFCRKGRIIKHFIDHLSNYSQIVWLHEHYIVQLIDVRAEDNNVIRGAAAYGRLGTLQWLFEHFTELTVDDIRVWSNEPIRTSGGNGELEVLEWIFNYFAELTVDDMRAGDNDAMICAAELGHVKVLQWMFTRFPELTADELRLEVSKWWPVKSNRKPDYFDFTRLKTLKWMFAHFPELATDDYLLQLMTYYNMTTMMMMVGRKQKRECERGPKPTMIVVRTQKRRKKENNDKVHAD